HVGPTHGQQEKRHTSCLFPTPAVRVWGGYPRGPSPPHQANGSASMSLNHRQRYKLRLIETRLLVSDPRLAGMLGMFGRLCAGHGMPAWEQVPSRQVRLRQAAALLAEAVTLAASARGFFSPAVLALAARAPAVVTAIVRGGCPRPSATRHGRTRLARADRR